MQYILNMQLVLSDELYVYKVKLVNKKNIILLQNGTQPPNYQCIFNWYIGKEM